MYKIAILVTQLGESHKKIIGSFKERLADYPESSEYDVEILETDSTVPSLIERKVRDIISEEFDLIVPVGSRCTLAVQKETALRRYPTPVVFTGVGYPDDNGVTIKGALPYSHVTGISMAAASNITPLQMILRLHPHLSHFVVPYSVSSHRERIDFDVWKMVSYLQQFCRQAIAIPVNDASSIKDKIRPHMKKECALVLPVGCMISKEIPAIEALCKEFDATLFGNANGQIPKTALFGYDEDLSFMGAKTAEYVYKITSNKITPTVLPLFEVRSPRYLAFNKERADELGIICPPDLLCSTDEATEDAHLPMLHYSVLDGWATLFGKRIMHAICPEAEKNKDTAHYCYRHVESDVYDREYHQRKIEEAAHPYFNATVTLHADEFAEVQKEMLRLKAPHPILSITIGEMDPGSASGVTSNIDSGQAGMTHPTGMSPPRLSPSLVEGPESSTFPIPHPDWPAAVPITQVRIEKIDSMLPVQLLDLLHSFRITVGRTKRKLKNIGLLYSADPHNLPPELLRYIATIEKHLSKEGRKLIHTGDWDEKVALQKGHELVRTADATFLLEEFIHPDLAFDFATHAYKKRHLVCGAGLNIADAFAVSYGLREETVGPKLFRALQLLLHEDKTPQNYFSIPCVQGYKIMITREVCQWLDIPLPEGLALSIKHGIGLEAAIHAQVKHQQPMRP